MNGILWMATFICNREKVLAVSERLNNVTVVSKRVNNESLERSYNRLRWMRGW